MNFSFSVLIFLSFRLTRPTASEPERLPDKPARPDDNAAAPDGPGHKRPRAEQDRSSNVSYGRYLSRLDSQWKHTSQSFLWPRQYREDALDHPSKGHRLIQNSLSNSLSQATVADYIDLDIQERFKLSDQGGVAKQG